jgi:hypothetical protein
VAAEDTETGAGQGQDGEPLNERVSSLEAGQDSLSGKIDKILGILGGRDSAEHEEQPTGGGNVADEIRAQLDERDRKRAADDQARADSDRLGAIEAKVSELAEKAPEPMPRRIEKFMGW